MVVYITEAVWILPRTIHSQKKENFIRSCIRNFIWILFEISRSGSVLEQNQLCKLIRSRSTQINEEFIIIMPVSNFKSNCSSCIQNISWILKVGNYFTVLICIYHSILLISIHNSISYFNCLQCLRFPNSHLYEGGVCSIGIYVRYILYRLFHTTESICWP